MAGKETAEDKIARIVRDTLAGERQRAEDEKDPAVGRLRRIIREEVTSVFDAMVNDEGDAKSSRSRRRTDDAGDDEDEGGLAKVLGLR